jgi:hypothetical protein
VRRSAQRLPGRLLARTIRLFEGERPLVGLVVAHRRDLRSKLRRLLERQLGKERCQHAVERATMPVRARRGLGRRAGNDQYQLATAKFGLGTSPRGEICERSTVQRLVHLGDLAGCGGAALRTEYFGTVLERLRGAVG